MKNHLNKIILGLGLFLMSLGFAVSAAENLVIADPSNPGKTRITSIAASGTSVTGLNTVASAAVSGTTNSAGSGDSAKVVKLNPSGKLDSSLFESNSIPVSAIVSGGSIFTTNIFQTSATNRIFISGIFSTNANVTVYDFYIVPVDGHAVSTDYRFFINGDTTSGNYISQAATGNNYAIASSGAGKGGGWFRLFTYPGRRTEFNSFVGASAAYSGFWDNTAAVTNVSIGSVTTPDMGTNMVIKVTRTE